VLLGDMGLSPCIVAPEIAPGTMRKIRGRPICNRNYIDSVQITMAERFGIEGRGKF
jgi:hypothetical protein